MVRRHKSGPPSCSTVRDRDMGLGGAAGKTPPAVEVEAVAAAGATPRPLPAIQNTSHPIAIGPGGAFLPYPLSAHAPWSRLQEFRRAW